MSDPAARSRFLVNISHDLRNPLHGILSYANFGLKKSDLDPPPVDKLRHYFQSISDAGNRLQSLLNDTIELAKLDSGQVRFFLKERNLIKLLQSVIIEVRREADPLGVAIDLRCQETTIESPIDNKQIANAFRQLLTGCIAALDKSDATAVHFEVGIVSSANGGEAVRVSLHAPSLELPPDQLDIAMHILDQSDRIDPQLRLIAMKLAICDQIVTAHNGRLQVEVEPTGGTRWTIQLPAVRQA